MRRMPAKFAAAACGIAAVLALLPFAWLDSTGLELALNTLWLVGGTILICLPLGVALAWLLFRTDLPLRRLWLVLLTASLFVPLYLHAAAWDAGFGIFGWFTRLLGNSGPVLLERWRGALFVHVVGGLPWVVLIVGAGMRAVERRFEEDALLCMNPWRVLARVTLPRSAAAVGVAALWVALVTAGEMTATNVFRVRTYTEETYLALANWATPNQALAIAAPPLGVVVVLAWLMLSTSLRHSPRVGSNLAHPSLTFNLASCRWPIFIAVTLLLGFLILTPIGSLVYRAGLTLERSGDSVVRHWSAVQTASVVVRSLGESRQEFGWTLRLAGWCTAWAVLLAIPVAWWCRRGGGIARATLSASAVVWAIPGPIVALFVIWLMNWRVDSPPGDRSLLEQGMAFVGRLYDETLVAPALALTLRTMPLAIWIIWAGFRAVPTATLESAAVDGAGPWTTFWRVALPQSWRAIASAICVVFIVASSDLATTILLLPPGVETVARRLFGLIHSSTDDQTAGLSLALLAILSPLTLIAAITLRRLGRRPKSPATLDNSP